MSSLKTEIIDLVSKSPGLTDRGITNRLRGPQTVQQPVNQACRQLEVTGVLKRSRRHDGLIGNYPTDHTIPDKLSSALTPIKPATPNTEQLSEDEVKGILVNWLEHDGWSVEVAWGTPPEVFAL